MASGRKKARLAIGKSGNKGPTTRPWRKQKPKGKDECARHFMRRWRQRVQRAGSNIEPHVALKAINEDIQTGKGQFASFVWSESSTRTHWQIKAAGKSWHVVYNRKVGSVVTVFLDPLTHGGELKRFNRKGKQE